MNRISFEERRLSDPQGLIDDLVGQTTRQAVAISEKNTEIDRLRAVQAEALVALEAWSQWEADVILDSRCWPGMEALPTITQELWDRLTNGLQGQRNRAIEKLKGGV